MQVSVVVMEVGALRVETNTQNQEQGSSKESSLNGLLLNQIGKEVTPSHPYTPCLNDMPHDERDIVPSMPLVKGNDYEDSMDTTTLDELWWNDGPPEEVHFEFFYGFSENADYEKISFEGEENKESYATFRI